MDNKKEVVLKITTNHQTIRSWIEKMGGKPVSFVGKETPDVNEGVISIEFDHNDSKHKTHIISWEEFFEKFDQSHLAFQFIDNQQKETTVYYKFISRDGE